MKKICTVLIAILICFGCSGNDKDPQDNINENDVLATINDYKLTLSEFNTLLKFESSVDPEFEVTFGNREKFLDYLIEKELYIQEASKLKLDRSESFVRSIEKYWESTLIRQLLDLKQKEFLKKIIVTKEDIQSYYQANKSHFDNAPLQDAEKRVVQAITRKKVSEMNNVWISSLKQSAAIEINTEKLK